MSKQQAAKLFKNVASIFSHATIANGQIGYQESEEECRAAMSKFQAAGIKAQAMSRDTWEKMAK